VNARRWVGLLPLALLVGCGGGADSDRGGDGAESTRGAVAPDEAGFEVPDDVLTAEEAEAQAAQEITAENAAAELKKLEEAIGGG
jgi:hypothetical protein